MSGGIGSLLMDSLTIKKGGRMKNLWKLLKTRTVWVNILGGALQLVNLGTGQVIPAEYAVIIQGVLNIAIRAITTKPVSEK